VFQYETAINADSFLVITHRTTEERRRPRDPEHLQSIIADAAHRGLGRSGFRVNRLNRPAKPFVPRDLVQTIRNTGSDGHRPLASMIEGQNEGAVK
jgi:hypothetical protein